MSKPAIICHGGAWNIPDELVKLSIEGVETAVNIGWDILKSSGSAISAVEKTVNCLEENTIYDAGIGASLNEIGEIELDAIIIDGKNLDFGAVAGATNIIHTISLARKVLEETNHVMVIGEGTKKFIKEINFPTINQKRLISKYAQEKWDNYRKFKGAVTNLYNTNLDTVGAVAIDEQGNIAAGTSTGGITGKMIGRVGDSSIIGSGAFADNSNCGISTTGHGESILKVTLASRIANSIENGTPPKQAVEQALAFMKAKVKGLGGVIVITSKGEIVYNFTTKRMAWAAKTNNQLKSGI